MKTMRFFCRQHLPKWLLIGVFLYWSFGIWQGYTTANPHAYDENSEAVVLSVVDRSLRINDALSDEPELLQDLLGYQQPKEALQSARESLLYLEEKGFLQDQGERVLALLNHQLHEESDQENVGETIKRILEGEIIDAPMVSELETQLQQTSAQWWDMEFAKMVAARQSLNVFSDELQAQNAASEQLLVRAKFGSWFTWMIFLTGLVMLPMGLARLQFYLTKNQSALTVSYTHRWSISLLLFLIIATQLVSDSFIRQFTEVSLWLDARGLLKLHEFSLQVIMDFLWRMIPPVLLLVLLFRKPSLMAKGFRLWQKPDWVLIFSLYAALIICDYLLYGLLGGLVEFDPTMGLSQQEYGWQGLIFGIVSGCIFAPVAEEFVYRGFLFNTLLRKCGFWLAAFLATLIFAISHFYDLYGTISVGIFGFSTAVLYYSTRSLTNTILLHALYNFSITLPSWLIFHYPQ